MHAPLTRECCARLTAYALRRLRRFGVDDPVRAEDFAFEALSRHLTDDQQLEYDAERYASVYYALCSTVNGLINNWLRKRSTNAERPVGDDLDAATSGSNYETTFGRRDQLRRVVDDVQAQFAQDKLVLGLLRLFLQGEDRPRMQAEALGVPITEVRNAIRRLRHHLRRALTPEHRGHLGLVPELT
jgi:DNA-directed RNA polymerase specialized sigma24 family protein